MPIYEYCCQKCDHEFEVEQRITDEPIKKCPSCRSQKAKRLISKTSFVLKGGGWYNDLYSSTGSSDSASDAPASESSGSAESSKDSGESTKKSGESSTSEPSTKKDVGKSKPDAKGKKKSAA